jgi:hypothetical protein
VFVALASVKGAPGVSTACLALAATWPRGWQPVVVEVDPSGGDLSVWHGLSGEPGLVSLAAASRRSRGRDLLWPHTQQLRGGLPVVCAPMSAGQASAALDVLLAAPDLGFLTEPRTLPRPGTATGRRTVRVDGSVGEQVVVLADVGRLASGISPVEGAGRLLAGADVVLLVARNDVPGIVHVAAGARMLSGLRGSGEGGQWLRPLLTGAGGYGPAEVASVVGLPVAGLLPDDDRAAAVLSGRRGARLHRLSRSSLLRAASEVAASLAAEYRRTHLSWSQLFGPPHEPARTACHPPMIDGTRRSPREARSAPRAVGWQGRAVR